LRRLDFRPNSSRGPEGKRRNRRNFTGEREKKREGLWFYLRGPEISKAAKSMENACLGTGREKALTKLRRKRVINPPADVPVLLGKA